MDSKEAFKLPKEIIITEQNDPMLARIETTPKATITTSKFANFGFRSPSLFKFESRKVVNDGGNSPDMNEIYNSSEQDDPFSFTYNRQEFVRTPTNTFTTTAVGGGAGAAHSPVSFYHNSNDSRAASDHFAIDFTNEGEDRDDTGSRGSPGLYEALPFRSFHMGNSARSEFGYENPMATTSTNNEVYYTNRNAPVSPLSLIHI